MDPIEHASIPALSYLALSNEPHLGALLVLTTGAVFPDLDALTKEHRSYLHSILPFIPALIISYHFGGLLLLFTLGWASHIFLDFFTGIVPFAYPLSRKGYGVWLHVNGGISGLRIRGGLLTGYPTPRRDYNLNIGGSVALLLFTLATLIIRMYKL